MTRTVNTIINVYCTVLSGESCLADTFEVIGEVHTHTLVLAWLNNAIINIHFTELASETRLADATV